jgi:DUF4097 and DUF4098 domain-containing protein YvlB
MVNQLKGEKGENKMNFCKRGFLAWAITAALGLMAVAVPARSAEGSFDRTLNVAGTVDVDVTTGSGNITVRRGEPGTVRIHGEIRAHANWGLDEDEAERKVKALESNPPIEQTGNIIRVGHIQDPDLSRNISINYELVVPAETQLKSKTGSGNQAIQGIRGPARVSSGSGSLKISDIGDEVRAETGSGDIQVDAVHGSAYLRTGSGSIRGEGMGGAIAAETGSGNLQLSQSAPGPVKVETGSGTAQLTGIRGSLRAQTGSGDITAEGEPTGDWILHTGSGDLTVRIPSNAGFDLEAHAGSGRITTTHPITMEGNLNRHELRGKVGGGGFHLEMDTGSGNVRIE